MGAMWTFDAGTGRRSPTYLADLKGASSVAHVHGKPFTGAESMTAFHRPWSYTPRRLKHVADLRAGARRDPVLHPHLAAPADAGAAARASGSRPFLGQAFIRTEPWAELAGPWIDYLARCSWLLNQGAPAVDVAVFVGEEAPRHRRCSATSSTAAVPAGFDFDYVDLDALEHRFAVDGRRSWSRATAGYRVLLPRRVERRG